ncbi:MAG: polymerase subunit epsilon [Bradyrhizobium sp.]|nr:polymerase subunit epsilon [Bradyrhizobium sp.]
MASQLDMFSDDERPRVIKLEAGKRDAPLASTHLSEESMLHALEATGRYRILRKLEPREVVGLRRPGFPLTGIIVDTETTGLDSRQHEIIEIGLVVFTFNEEGEVGDVLAVYGGLQ